MQVKVQKGMKQVHISVPFTIQFRINTFDGSSKMSGVLAYCDFWFCCRQLNVEQPVHQGFVVQLRLFANPKDNILNFCSTT
jgi:hypothetical protein